MEDRAYQSETIDKVRAQIMLDLTAIVIVLPTGGGKTVIAAYLINSGVSKGSRILFCAHRRELIVQTYRKLRAIGVDMSIVGIVMGDGRVRIDEGAPVSNLSRPNAQIQIASIDTLRGLMRRGKLPHFDLVFIDEAHRCLSASYLELKRLTPYAIHLGLTATPYRASGKGLGAFYNAIVVGATPSQLIAGGYIVDPECWTVANDQLPDLSAVKMTGGDYDEASLSEACNRKQLVGNIVDHWIRRTGGRRTVCFAVDVEHSKRIVASFSERGIPAEHLDGETPANERDAILARLARGETLVVSNCGVLCEGWDQPSVKCCILARPTRSTGLYLQQAGRILRPWEGIGAIILDHSGNVHEHGLPSEDREFSLGDSKRKRIAGDKAESTHTCPKCFAILASAVRQCGCGYLWPDIERSDLEHIDGELVAITRDEQAEKRRYYDHLCAEAERHGCKPGWVWHKFRERYGVPPPKSFPRPKVAQKIEGVNMGRHMSPLEEEEFRSNLIRIGTERGMRNPAGWARRLVEAKRGRLSGVTNVVDLDKPEATKAKQESKWSV